LTGFSVALTSTVVAGVRAGVIEGDKVVFVAITVIFGVITEGSDGAESVHPVNTTATMTRRIVITPA